MRRILLVCCLLLTLMVAPISAQDNGEPPYLFYYSRILGGLIIERADDTDSRLIAEDVIPSGYAGIAGAGWSPSGRYFAAFASQWGAHVRRPDVSHPLVFDLNGNEVMQSLQWTLTGSIVAMEWSPHDHDLLLIWTHYRQTYQRNDAVGLWLYDIAADELMVDFIIRAGSTSWSSPLQWDEDNEQIVFYVSPDTEFSDQYKVTMRFDIMLTIAMQMKELISFTPTMRPTICWQPVTLIRLRNMSLSGHGVMAYMSVCYA